MGSFDSGVKGYVYGTVTVRVGFPIDWNDLAHISCVHCQFYSPISYGLFLYKVNVRYSSI